MLAADIPPQVANFWAPVSQIVPVFALALVIEGRRLASGWAETKPWLRGLQGVFSYVAATLLFTVEGAAFVLMSRGISDSSIEVFAIGSLMGIFAGLVLFPLARLFQVATVEWVFVARRFLPWSAWSRRRREALKSNDELAKGVVDTFNNHEWLEKEIAHMAQLVATTEKDNDKYRKFIYDVETRIASGERIPNIVVVEATTRRLKVLFADALDYVAKMKKQIVKMEEVRDRWNADLIVLDLARENVERKVAAHRSRRPSAADKARLDELVEDYARSQSDVRDTRRAAAEVIAKLPPPPKGLDAAAKS